MPELLSEWPGQEIARDEIRQQHRTRSCQRGGRYQSTQVGAHDSAHEVRSDQTDEGDAADDATAAAIMLAAVNRTTMRVLGGLSEPDDTSSPS